MNFVDILGAMVGVEDVPEVEQHVYDDNGELLYEAGSYREHAERLKKEPPEGHKI